MTKHGSVPTEDKKELVENIFKHKEGVIVCCCESHIFHDEVVDQHVVLKHVVLQTMTEQVIIGSKFSLNVGTFVGFVMSILANIRIKSENYDLRRPKKTWFI